MTIRSDSPFCQGANQIVAQNLDKNHHAHTVAVPEERYLCRITTPPRMRSGGTLFWILDTVPPERILVFSLFFYKDSIPPGRLRAVRYCVKSAGCKVMGANKH